MKFNQQSTIKCSLKSVVFFLILWQVQCNAQIDDYYWLDLTRKRLVTQFTRLEEPLIESSYFNDVQEITSLLQRVRDLWLRIVNLNSAILKQLSLEKRIWELAYQSQLEEYASKLFSLGDEALCPPQMKLFNGPGNVGFFCDCSNSVEMIYSNITGTCYVPYFQGPCKNGEWLILNENDTAECRPIPQGCLADGQHVFCSTQPKLEKKCWKLGTRGPCLGENDQLRMKGIDVECFTPAAIVPDNVISASLPSAPLQQSACPRGSYRNQILKCKTSFI